MDYEIDFLSVGEDSNSGDAIALRYGHFTSDPANQRVVVIDGGYAGNGPDLVEHIKSYYGTKRVDLVVSTHPDQDHIGGLTAVLDDLDVGELWLHRPWEHAERIRDMFEDGRITDQSLGQRFRASMEQAWELEKKACRMGIPITEPFAGTNDGRLYVLGPMERYYEELLVQFGVAKPAASASAGASSLSVLVRVAKAVARVVTETWTGERLRAPAPDAVSPRNNSSTVMLLDLDDERVLFTADAGVPALERAADWAEAGGVVWSNVKKIQVPHHGSRRNVGPTILDRIVGVPVGRDDPPTKSAIVSCAKDGAPKHPARKVTNAFIRRGATVCKTAGSGFCWRSSNVPMRPGWGPATPFRLRGRVRGGVLTMDLAQFNPASYEFTARVRPLLLICLPAGAAVVAWFPEALVGWNFLAGVLVTVGIPFILSEWIAEIGRQRQPALWDNWGGPPTTRLLRYSDSRIDPITKSRIHAKLRVLCPEAAIPLDKAEESSDPAGADGAYRAAAEIARVCARQDRATHPNVFSRELPVRIPPQRVGAARPFGIAVSIAGLLASVASLIWSTGSPACGFTAAALSLLIFGMFAVIVTESWVEQAADVYAHRLLEATDVMASRHRG